MGGYIQATTWKVKICLKLDFYSDRSDNDIKNHFYSTLRRSLRRINKELGDRNSKPLFC